MNNIKVKVVSNQYIFGEMDKYVYVLMMFKYKIDNNYYVIYGDKESDNLYWGAAYFRDDTIICMSSSIDSGFITNIFNNIFDYIEVLK